MSEYPQNMFRWIFTVMITISVCFFAYFTSPPNNFPSNSVFTIESGQSVSSVAKRLEERGIISSGIVFRVSVILFGGEKRIQQGDYVLRTPETVFTLVQRFISSDFHIEQVKITIPEGWTVIQISEYLTSKVVGFNSKEFLELAKKEEGFLFPETYFISPFATSGKLVATLRDGFDTRVSDIDTIKNSKRSLKEIITMASIVEAEGRTTESRKIIAGILWKRLDIGMRLQVDATFSYINGKNTYELTADDLKIDSPYNTYVYKGLPPGPINNPGLDSIEATLYPTTSDYLYFYSSKDGEMYYGKTYEDHKKNIATHSN